MLMRDSGFSDNFFGMRIQEGISEGDFRFGCLRRAVDEWSFLSNLFDVEMEGVTQSDLDRATELMDEMIFEWNRWVLREGDDINFMVLRTYLTEEAVSQRGIFFAPGERVLLGFSCSRVLASISDHPETIQVPSGEGIVLYERKVVDVHCFIGDDDELRVLPISIVPKVKVLPRGGVD